MSPRSWHRWDDDGVADRIDDYWERSVLEHAHRLFLAQVCAALVARTGPDFLEVGCGPGRVYSELVPRVFPASRYAGVDVSHRMLGLARQRYPEGRWLQADGYALPFRDRCFDLAVAFEVVGHLPELADFVAELFRVSRAGAAFTVWPTDAAATVEGREVVGSASFLQRKFPHAVVQAEIARAVGDRGARVETLVLSADCWLYLILRDDGRPGLAASTIRPFPGFREILVGSLLEHWRSDGRSI